MMVVMSYSFVILLSSSSMTSEVFGSSPEFGSSQNRYFGFSTMSLADFKEIKKVETIEVKQNPKTRKLFFVYGVETGAVSSRYKQGIPNNDVISLVETDKGDSFFLLHNLNEGPTVSKR